MLKCIVVFSNILFREHNLNFQNAGRNKSLENKYILTSF
jgi:hypothetical protein